MAGKYTEAQKRATKKYKESKKRVELWLSPEKKDLYRKLAERNGMRLSEYIICLLDEKLEKHDAERGCDDESTALHG